jgi:hypothetical protein
MNSFTLTEETIEGIETFQCGRCNEIHDGEDVRTVSKLSIIPHDGYITAMTPTKLHYSVTMYCKDCNDCGCPKKPIEDTK